MKKTIFTASLIITIAIQAYGQKPCNIKDLYKDFISIQKTTYNQKDYLTKQVVETKEKSCLSELVNHNTMFMEYLVINFSSNADAQSLLKLPDSITLREMYFRDLNNDSLFNSVMTEWVSKTMDRNVPKDTLSMDNLMNIAVKYFSIIRVTDEGYYAGKVCIGVNDIKKTENERKPLKAIESH